LHVHFNHFEWLTNSLCKDSSIKVRFSAQGNQTSLSPEISATIFRLAQEALNNVKNHSHATELYVSISSQDSLFKVVIKDNGRGFVLPSNASELADSGKFGIIGMYERAQLIGTKLNVSSQPGKGTEVTICFDKPKPLRETNSSEKFDGPILRE
jgi:signal transduction histidine kinase